MGVGTTNDKDSPNEIIETLTQHGRIIILKGVIGIDIPQGNHNIITGGVVHGA